MQIVENVVATGKTIVLDDKTFVNCHFTNCTLVYEGGEMLSKDTKFENCPLQFAGAASRTANLLASFGVLKPGMMPSGTPPVPTAGTLH